MPLEAEDGLLNRNLTMCRRAVVLAVESRIVRFVLLKHVVNSCKEHSGNGDGRFLVSTALL